LMFTKVPEFSSVARWTYHAHQPASDLWFLCIDAVSYLDMDDMVTQRCYTGVQSWADILNHLEKLSCPLNYRYKWALFNVVDTLWFIIISVWSC
jgi:hypothetical protein